MVSQDLLQAFAEPTVADGIFGEVHVDVVADGVASHPAVQTARFACAGWRARAWQADRAGTRRTMRTRQRTSPPAHGDR